jgi:transient receptor potential (TRP) ion channel
VGPILGIFTIIAVVSSIATAIYGDAISEIRTHHAHSLSILVVFAVFHHIYFTGALSMNWPSVLVAWWSNFAWAAGMIYDSSMQNSLTKFMGRHVGSTLAVGAASAGTDSSSNVGGGYNIHQIYKRSNNSLIYQKYISEGEGITKRSLLNSTSGFKWYGSAVRKGLPLPGNYSGFAGTLSEEGIPASNALLTGLIWFLILILVIVGGMTLFKYILEGLYGFKWMKTQRLDYFRQHWIRFIIFAILKACYIAFFMMMFLTIFQLTYDGAPAAIAIAAIVFAIFFLGTFAICGYACHYRFRVGTWVSEPDRFFIERTKAFGVLPWFKLHSGCKVRDSTKVFSGSIPGWRLSHDPQPNQIPVHEDEDYIRKFGWLTSRFRLSRWWFFMFWIVYEFVRACFFAGASGHALIQVYCLLVVEIVAFVVILKLKPYEGQRLNVIMVYLLGFSKVLTVALSSAFDINFSIARITATIIGVLIIIIQGLLTLALLVCISLSAISSYFSVTRNREQIKPRRWMPYRERYFAHIQQRATDGPPVVPAPVPVERKVTTPKEPYFSVNTVRRMAKIEDEDPEFQKEIATDPRNPSVAWISDPEIHPVNSPPPQPIGITRRASVAHSIRSTASHSSLPYAAAVHRGSWATKDFMEYQENRDPMTERVRPISHLSRRSSRESFAGSRPVSKSSRQVLAPATAAAEDSGSSVAVGNSPDTSPGEVQSEFMEPQAPASIPVPSKSPEPPKTPDPTAALLTNSPMRALSQRSLSGTPALSASPRPGSRIVRRGTNGSMSRWESTRVMEERRYDIPPGSSYGVDGA